MQTNSRTRPNSFPRHRPSTFQTGLCLGVVCLMFLAARGCDRKDTPRTSPPVSDPNHVVDKICETTAPLYQSYLDGDRDQARRGLEQILSTVENTPGLPSKFRNRDMWLNYARLYVLEKRTGNPLLAEAHLIEARYWHLRELRGSEGLSSDQAASQEAEWTPEEYARWVDRLDAPRTPERQGPRYLRQWATSQPSSSQ